MDAAPRREPDPIGQRLVRALEERQHWTKRRLARAAEVPPSTISGICTGRRKGADLPLGYALRICMVLGISLEWLAGRWIDDSETHAPPGHREWLLIGPGGTQHIAGTLLNTTLEGLFGHTLEELCGPEDPTTKGV
jgi:plasmid maintenance system antidote protein VapI